MYNSYNLNKLYYCIKLAHLLRFIYLGKLTKEVIEKGKNRDGFVKFVEKSSEIKMLQKELRKTERLIKMQK